MAAVTAAIPSAGLIASLVLFCAGGAVSRVFRTRCTYISLDIYVLSDTSSGVTCFYTFLKGVHMHRSSPNRGRSRKSFNKRASRTAGINLGSPLRGGWRL